MTPTPQAQAIRLLRPSALAFRLCSCIVLALAGCATPPEPEPPPPPPKVFRSVRPEAQPPDSTFDAKAPSVLAADVNRALVRPATAPAKPTAPRNASFKTPPKAPIIQPPPIPSGKVDTEWKLALALGQRKATLNGVQLWLLEPAVAFKPKKRNAKPRIDATEADMRYTVGPLLYAPHEAALVKGRPVRVFIDPGHGGMDTGATYGTRKESAINLDIARRLASLLTRAGFEVKLSRQSDTIARTLDERAEMASAWKADLFVSIHQNASASSAPKGIETYAIPPVGFLSTDKATASPISAKDRAAAQKAEFGNAHDVQNMRLAWCVHRRLVNATGRTDRGIRRARFSVLRQATMPAILVEVGFLSNPSEAAILGSPTGREKAAIGLCRGIMDFAAGHISPAHPILPITPPAPPPPAP